MELRKLSVNVNKKTNASIQKLFLGLCVLAGMVILAIILGNATKNNRKQVELFRAEIDKSMSEKIAFIDTVAAGMARRMPAFAAAPACRELRLPLRESIATITFIHFLLPIYLHNFYLVHLFTKTQHFLFIL